jgi:hypothetical protein
MTWQQWGSKQALEKREASLSLMEVFNIALKLYGTVLAGILTNAIQNVKILTN